MQGDGTKENPFIPTAWDEFVYAVGYSKEAYVTMPEGGGTFDMNKIDPTGKLTVNVNCLVLDGNDWVIESPANTQFVITQDGNNDSRDEKGGWCYSSNGVINRLHFHNIISDAKQVLNLNVANLTNCKISGIIGGSPDNYAFGRGELNQCSVNLKFIDKACEIAADSSSKTRLNYTKAIIDSSDSQGIIYNRIRGNYAKIFHTTNANDSMFSIYGNATLYISNASNYVTSTTGSRTTVTDEQLKDVAYLRSIGFPIMR